MKYNININQKAIIESGLDIDYKNAAILDTCMMYGHSSSCVKLEHMGKIYYWFDHSKIAKELPLLSLKKDSVYRRMKKMCEEGLLSQHPENDKMGKSFYSFEDTALGLYSEPSDKKTDTLGKQSVDPSDKKPTDNNTIDNNTIIKSSCPSQDETVFLGKIIDFKITKETPYEEKVIKQFHSLFCTIATPEGQELKDKTLLGAKMPSWKKELGLMVRIDKRSREDLLKVYNHIKFSKDRFWANTVSSISGVRKNFDTIVAKIRAEEEKAKATPKNAKETPFKVSKHESKSAEGYF